MKFSTYLPLLVLICFSTFSQAQNCEQSRYKHRVFDEIKITHDIVYGQVNPYEAAEMDELVDIKLDFYEPVGDDLEKRPLVVSVFGGAFTFGAKEDADVQAWCDSLSRRGYACAAINYRLGFDPTQERGAYRAVYRAVQDLRAAIRYLEEDPDNLDFRVDPDNIFVEGQSAGAITAIHTAFLSDEERPTASFANNLALLGERKDLGCLDCSGNNYNQPVKIKGILSMWGALENFSFADPEEAVAILMVHGELDPVVPYGTGRPFQLPTFPTVHGSNVMKERYAELGFYHEFYPYLGNSQHTVYGEPIAGTFPTENWLPIFENSQKFLYKLLKYQSPTPSGETAISVNMTTTYTVPASANDYCWSVTGGTIMTDNGNEITVQWQAEEGAVQVRENNEYDLKGEPGVLNVGTNNDPLPLDLLAFNGTIDNKNISLEWTVANAQNVSHFSIEKSANGSNFITINEKRAIENTIQKKTYTWVDNNPYQGTNYYRLKMIDDDGQFRYSTIVQMNVVRSGINLYLNDSRALQVDFGSDFKEAATLEFYNLQGQSIFVNKLYQSQTIALPELPAGIYIANIKTEHRQWQQRFFVY